MPRPLNSNTGRLVSDSKSIASIPAVRSGMGLGLIVWIVILMVAIWAQSNPTIREYLSYIRLHA